MSEEYTITKEPVPARDESGAKLFGWTMQELGTLIGAFFVALFLVPGTYTKVIVMILAYLWVKKIKALLPERFLTNWYNFHRKLDKYWRSGMHDTEWVHPIEVPRKHR
jgi:hypothetical protein